MDRAPPACRQPLPQEERRTPWTSACPTSIARCRTKCAAFIREHGHKSPKLGGGRKRPDQKALDWQKLLVDHGYVARTIPREYGGFGAEPDVLEAAVIASEFAAAGIYAGLTNQGISMLVPTLLEVGTETNRRSSGSRRRSAAT